MLENRNKIIIGALVLMVLLLVVYALRGPGVEHAVVGQGASGEYRAQGTGTVLYDAIVKNAKYLFACPDGGIIAIVSADIFATEPVRNKKESVVWYRSGSTEPVGLGAVFEDGSAVPKNWSKFNTLTKDGQSIPDMDANNAVVQCTNQNHVAVTDVLRTEYGLDPWQQPIGEDVGSGAAIYDPANASADAVGAVSDGAVSDEEDVLPPESDANGGAPAIDDGAVIDDGDASDEQPVVSDKKSVTEQNKASAPEKPQPPVRTAPKKMIDFSPGKTNR